mmetsp:Transcript_20962/g.63167  ORF Transcript_20962/g.63167 Transcript_20962/m.63167 type:complete len:279 (+) Transcript_20962:413-1249(+)
MARLQRRRICAAFALAGPAAPVARAYLSPRRDARYIPPLSANPWDPPAPEAYYEVRFTSPRDVVYEGLGSVAAKASAGVTTTTRCESLFEANALARRVLARAPSLAIATFKVSANSVRLLDAAARRAAAPGRGDGGRTTAPGRSDGGRAAASGSGDGDAADEWVGDFSDIVANAAANAAAAKSAAPVGGDDSRQKVWDDMLQDLAETEAAAARTDVDRAWSQYLASLRLGAELDVTVIGGDAGLRPCPLCNGKGVRTLFGKETTCEWCGGSGSLELDA